MGTRVTLTICALAFLAPGTGRAQTVPEGQSCGGILCDMGVFGHKTPPPPPPPPPPPVVAVAPPPAVEPKLAPPPEPEVKPKARVAHRKPPPKVRSAKVAGQAHPSAPPAATAPVPPHGPPGKAPMIFQTVDPRL